MGECRDCRIEACTLTFNNYRRFHSGWHAGGMNCIPGNIRCTIRNCEAAYNIAADGIWFDCDNAEIRILSNISHHNDGAGIFYEINKGGGIIADNPSAKRVAPLPGERQSWTILGPVVAADWELRRTRRRFR